MGSEDGSKYVGRFAPSPSGPLHFGSLVCALASYLHAKQNQGLWLVRIEDIDTPRIDDKYSKIILESLNAHQLVSDNEPVYQSQRHRLYESQLHFLEKQHRVYACECSRKTIRARSGHYDGFCRERGLSFHKRAIRFKQDQKVSHSDHALFEDLHWGLQRITHPIHKEDPVIKRADGIYAYHLAVVCDDIDQKVSHIVRGFDLVDTTPIHQSIYDAFNETPPRYLHIPVVVQAKHEKLSKQHHSPAIDNDKALDNLKLALQYLGCSPYFQNSMSNRKKFDKLANQMLAIKQIGQLLDWAVENWHLNLLPKQSELMIDVNNNTYSLPD